VITGAGSGMAGFKLFDRLPRGVKAAGRLFLEDARRILQQVSEAAVRAARVARGQSGTLRVGFTRTPRGVVWSRSRSGASGNATQTPSSS
jgi:DNA-binding transcriptional LysR family regulator